MSGAPDDLETRLRQLPQAELPAGLKSRVMAAASLAPRPSWRDRAWYSPVWRLAAAAMLLAMLAGDRWSAGTTWGETARPAPAAVEESVLVAAVGAEMGMPEAAMARLTARVEFVGLTSRESIDQAGAALR